MMPSPFHPAPPPDDYSYFEERGVTTAGEHLSPPPIWVSPQTLKWVFGCFGAFGYQPDGTPDTEVFYARPYKVKDLAPRANGDPPAKAATWRDDGTFVAEKTAVEPGDSKGWGYVTKIDAARYVAGEVSTLVVVENMVDTIWLSHWFRDNKIPAMAIGICGIDMGTYSAMNNQGNVAWHVHHRVARWLITARKNKAAGRIENVVVMFDYKPALPQVEVHTAGKNLARALKTHMGKHGKATYLDLSRIKELTGVDEFEPREVIQKLTSQASPAVVWNQLLALTLPPVGTRVVIGDSAYLLEADGIQQINKQLDAYIIVKQDARNYVFYDAVNPSVSPEPHTKWGSNAATNVNRIILTKLSGRDNGPAEKAISEIVLRDVAKWLEPRAVDKLVCIPSEPEGITVVETAHGLTKQMNVHFKMPYPVLDDLQTDALVDSYFSGFRKLLVMAGNHERVVDGVMSIIWHTYNNMGSSIPAMVALVGSQNTGKSTFLRLALMPCGITNLANEWAKASVGNRIGMASEVRKDSFAGADKGTSAQRKLVQIIEELNWVPNCKDVVHAITTGTNWLRLMYAEAEPLFYGVQLFATARELPWALEHSATTKNLNRREYFLRVPGEGDVFNGNIFDLNTLAGAYGFEPDTFKDYEEFNEKFICQVQARIMKDPMLSYSWFKRNYGEIVINPKMPPGCYEPRHPSFYGIQTLEHDNAVERLHGLPVITTHIAAALEVISSPKGGDKLRIPGYTWKASTWYYTFTLPSIFCQSIDDVNASHPFGRLRTVNNNYFSIHDNFLGKVEKAFTDKTGPGRVLRQAYTLAVLLSLNTRHTREKLGPDWNYILILIDALLGVKDCVALFRQTQFYKDRLADTDEHSSDIAVPVVPAAFLDQYIELLRNNSGIRQQLKVLGIANPCDIKGLSNG